MVKTTSYTLSLSTDLWEQFKNTFPNSISIKDRITQLIELEVRRFQDNGGKFIHKRG